MPESIALIILSDPQIYPPTINAANILADKGFNVYLYGLKYNNSDKVNIDLRVKVKYLGQQKRGIKNVLQYIGSIFRFYRDAYRHKFKWIIAYDAFAVVPVYLSTKLLGIKWVYHQHDFWEEPIGIFQKIIFKQEYNWGKRATIVSFPQSERAKIFFERSGMKKNIVIVHNGPRKNWINDGLVPNPIVNSLKKEFDHLLVYQGGLSKYFCLDNLIKSVKLCKSKFAIIFLGKELDKGIIDKLKDLAQLEEIENRIVFWKEYVAYDDLPQITSFCDIGITKLTHEDMYAPINDRYIAGASNKIAEYMGSGLPIISADTKDNRLYYSEDNIGLLCDATEPASIAEAIDELLLNKELRTSMSVRNKTNFIRKYNFDSQFEGLYQLMFPNN